MKNLKKKINLEKIVKNGTSKNVQFVRERFLGIHFKFKENVNWVFGFGGGYIKCRENMSTDFIKCSPLKHRRVS